MSKHHLFQRRMRVKNIGGAEYHVAVRPRQGRGCGKGDVLPSTKSTKKILLALYIKWKQYCITN